MVVASLLVLGGALPGNPDRHRLFRGGSGFLRAAEVVDFVRVVLSPVSTSPTAVTAELPRGLSVEHMSRCRWTCAIRRRVVHTRSLKCQLLLVELLSEPPDGCPVLVPPGRHVRRRRPGGRSWLGPGWIALARLS